MDKKQCLASALMAACLIASPMVFAQADYTQRNIFNHISDGMLTMFKSPDLKEQIINQRVELRAERRKSSIEKKNKDTGPERNYNNQMNDINNKDAREKYENDRKSAMDGWQARADQEKKDLNNQRDNDKKRIDMEKDNENKNYDKQKASIRIQYQDNPDMMNAKLKEADDNHQIRVRDLGDQSKNDPAKFDAKEQDLNASLDKQKDDLNKQYDARKAELR